MIDKQKMNEVKTVLAEANIKFDEEEFLSNYKMALSSVKAMYAPSIWDDLEKNINHNFVNSLKKGNTTMFENGKLNLDKMTKFVVKVGEFLERSNPEKYVRISEKTSEVESKTTLEENTKKVVDFNKPEEKKEFFDKLVMEYSQLETDEEKEEWKRDNLYGYDKNKEVLDQAWETKTKVVEIANEKGISEAQAVKEVLEENKDAITHIEIMNSSMQLKEEIKEGKYDPNKEKEFQEKIRQYETKMKHEKESFEINKEQNVPSLSKEIENIENVEKEGITIEKLVETSFDMEDMFLEFEGEQDKNFNGTENNEKQNVPNLSIEDEINGLSLDMGELYDNFGIEEVEPYDKPVSDKMKQTGMFQGLDPKDLENESKDRELNDFRDSYEIEIKDDKIKEHKGVWNTIKNGLKNFAKPITERFNRIRNKGLNKQKFIGTAENNTPSLGGDNVGSAIPDFLKPLEGDLARKGLEEWQTQKHNSNNKGIEIHFGEK